MKLVDAAALCEANSRAFTEVYKLYNFKDEDDLKAYVDFVIHEPVEWMRGFPAAWKSVGLFSKPRAAFHRLLKQPAVLDELTEKYCDHVHGVIWNAFKTHMNTILEKRVGVVSAEPTLQVVEGSSSTNGDSIGDSDEEKSIALTVESLDSESPLPPVPCVPWKQTIDEHKNLVRCENTSPIDYKYKYEVLFEVTQILLSSRQAADENVRLRTALSTLLSEFSRA